MENEIVKEAEFIETQIPNQPQWKKIEWLMESKKCSKEVAKEAFKEVWERVYQ